MKTKFTLLAVFCFIAINSSLAQQGFPVTDQQPVTIEGLTCGYKIKSLETKTVSDKGDFSRYSISFFVKNNTGQPRILPFRPGTNGMNGVADNLIQFNCLNATGARLTSKYVVIKAPPYNVYRNGGMVKMGYGVLPGQTVSADAIMIVPLNEQLNMQVFYIGYSQQVVPLGPAVSGPPPGPQPAPSANQPQPVFSPDNFYQIRNSYYNTFVNIQTGVINSSTIQNGWFSAQWQIIPVPGSNYVKIKNRWKGNFIDTERGYITMTPADQSPGTLWVLEFFGGNQFHIKNIQSGHYLSIIANQIKLTPGVANPGAGWMIQ